MVFDDTFALTFFEPVDVSCDTDLSFDTNALVVPLMSKSRSVVSTNTIYSNGVAVSWLVVPRIGRAEMPSTRPPVAGEYVPLSVVIDH
ncbi:MAG: hypothetical protein EBT42_07760 [Actinobacteria bacterium]|nr:hypothetical protein [Actinomycetota bacterium]